MSKDNMQHRQRGVALVVSLLFLLVVTLISVTAARNSSLSLQLSSNMQDMSDSLQAAEAGLFAALALAGTADDPFDRDMTVAVDPFAALDADPLANLSDPSEVDTEVRLQSVAGACPRPRAGQGGYSAGTIACDFYRVDSEHQLPGRARTRTSMGVIRPVLN